MGRLDRTEEVRLFPSTHVEFGGELEPRPQSPPLSPDSAADGSKQARVTWMSYLVELYYNGKQYSVCRTTPLTKGVHVAI